MKQDKETKEKLKKGMKVLKKLNEYLPDHFPDVEELDNFVCIKGIEEIALITIDHGVVHFEFDPFIRSQIDFEFLFIYSFVMNFIGNPYQDFYVSGLPFRFQINQFISRYLGATSRLRLREILDLMGVSEQGVSFSGKFGLFEESQLDELIKDVFERKNKTDMTVKSLALLIGIKVRELMDYLERNQTDEIIYYRSIPDKERVIYRKMQSTKE